MAAYPRERRRRPRIDVNLPVKIKYKTKEISNRTKNISVLGIYIETNTSIPTGINLEIKIVLPRIRATKTEPGKPISCSGIAYRSQRLSSLEPKKLYGTGIFFRSFKKKGEQELSKYIDTILSREKRIGKIFMRKRKRKQIKKGGEGKR